LSYYSKDNSLYFTFGNFCCDGKPSIAITWGDPHINTFDGNDYTELDDGDFFFLYQTSGAFVIEVRQSYCVNAACNYAAAIKYLDWVFIAWLQTNYTPHMNTSATAQPSEYGINLQYFPTQDRYQFTFPTGAIVQVFPLQWSASLPIYYMDVEVTLPTSFHYTVFGLCGYYDGNSTDDYVSSTGVLEPGTSAGILNFARSWAVPASQNLFTNVDAVSNIGPIFGGSSPLSIPPSPCTAFNSSGNLLTICTGSGCAPLPPINATNNINQCTNWTNQGTLYLEAVAACSIFNDSCCTSLGVNGTAFYLNCLCDYNIVKGPAAIDSDLSAYDAECQTAQNNAGVTCTPPTPSPPLGTPTPTPTPTPNACSIVTGVSPLSGGLYCSQNLTITGFNFLASTLTCSFNGYVVPAEKISNTEAICQVPGIILESSVTVYINSGSQCSESNGTYTLTNECCSNPASTSLSWGDPHINTIDGNAYTTYTSAGTYYFVYQTNGDFIIETTQFSCYTAYCNSAAAIKFLDWVAFIDFNITTGVVSTSYSGATMSSVGVTLDVINSQRFTYYLPTGAAVSILILPWASLNIYYLDVAVSLPQTYQTYTYGLSGYYDANPANDFTGSNGVVYNQTSSQLLVFTNSWLVPSALNLWTHASATFPVIFNGGDPSSGAPEACYVAPGPAPTRCSSLNDTTNHAIFGSAPINTLSFGQCDTNYIGTPSRACYENATWGPLQSGCYSAFDECPADTNYGHANWTATPIGTTGTGTCLTEYTGSPTRYCQVDMTWSTDIIGMCSLIACAAATLETNNVFPQTTAGQNALGSCTPSANYSGSPVATCFPNATWGPVTGPCAANTGCSAETYGNANWTRTTAGATASGVCNPGYSGTPSRACGANSQWSTSIKNICQLMQCSSTSVSGIAFSKTNINTYALGTCPNGTTGKPQLECLFSGGAAVWSTHLVGTACVS